MPRQLRCFEAIREATDQFLEDTPLAYVMGLGASDPTGIFGTTKGLVDKYGPNRILDMPTAENGMTGIAIGSAIRGMVPILTHQRIDFFLLALDQLINNAAKWHFMFGGKMKVPLVLRLILGRGWGQGPQHSQSLHSLFTHIPGLKVVMPSTPYNAKGLLRAAMEDQNPVVYIEHRWLHGLFGDVPEERYLVPLGKARIVQPGTNVTIVASSHMVVEAYKALAYLEKEGISAELIDLQTLLPLDLPTILESVKKTKRLIVIDPDWKTMGFAAEIVSLVVEHAFSYLEKPPLRITYPNYSCPSSWALAKDFYPTPLSIAAQVLQTFGKTAAAEILQKTLQQEIGTGDVPDAKFTGPF